MKAGVEEGKVGENRKQEIHNLYLFWIVYTPAEGSSWSVIQSVVVAVPLLVVVENYRKRTWWTLNSNLFPAVVDKGLSSFLQPTPSSLSSATEQPLHQQQPFIPPQNSLNTELQLLIFFTNPHSWSLPNLKLSNNNPMHLSAPLLPHPPNSFVQLNYLPPFPPREPKDGSQCCYFHEIDSCTESGKRNS